VPGFAGSGFLTADVEEPPFVVVSFVSITHTRTRNRPNAVTTKTVFSERLHRAAAEAEAVNMERTEGTVRTMIVDTRRSNTFRHTLEGENLDRMISAMRSDAKRMWLASQRAAERDEDSPVVVPNVERKPRPGGVFGYSSRRWPNIDDRPVIDMDVCISRLKTLLAEMYPAEPMPVSGASFGAGTLAAVIVPVAASGVHLHGHGELVAVVAVATAVKRRRPAHHNRPRRRPDYDLVPQQNHYALVFWPGATLIAQWSTHATLTNAEDAQDAVPAKTRSFILDASRWMHERQHGLQVTDAQILRARAMAETATADPFDYRTGRLPELDVDAQRSPNRRREPIPQ
jgi:hypothetical protein